MWDQINRLFRHELVPFPDPASSSSRHPLVHPLRAGAKRLSFRHPLLATLVIAFACTVQAQDLSPRPPDRRPALPPIIQEPNTDATYRALRSIGTGEVLTVKNVVLKRDAATFTLTGTVTFLAPVQGKVTGAVFFGQGTLELIPPIEVEKKSLAELTKEPALHEEFDQAVFRFTDDTFDELKKQSSPAASSEGDPVDQPWARCRSISGRNANIISTVASSRTFSRPTRRSVLGLHSRPPRQQQTSFLPSTRTDSASSVWRPRKSPYPLMRTESGAPGLPSISPTNTRLIRPAAASTASRSISNIRRLEATFDKSGKLDGIAQTTFVSTVDGLRVVPFDLFLDPARAQRPRHRREPTRFHSGIQGRRCGFLRNPAQAHGQRRAYDPHDDLWR